MNNPIIPEKAPCNISPIWLKVTDVAAYCRTGHNGVREWFRRSDFPAHLINGIQHVHKDDLDKYIREGRANK